MKNFFKKIFKKTPKKRSVVFYRNNYYHFFYLAQALRARGWDAIVVGMDSPESDVNKYYHGEDINLYDSDEKVFRKNIKKFYKKALSRFNLLHFTGDGYLSFFPHLCEEKRPWDIVKWKQANKKIAYTISGCQSGTSPSSVHQWSIDDNGLSVCERCIWQGNEVVCSDKKSLEWGEKIHEFCDLIFAETLPALDYMKADPKVIREPMSMCLDHNIWTENMEIPSEYLIDKDDNLLIYHAFGNYEIRNNNEKNIKGTPFIVQAVERLQQEGYKVKLIFFTDVPSNQIRYYQAQADIIVDQLNYGRYGATAREGMMLGKTVVCYLNHLEYSDEDRLESLQECPLVSATEKDIYDKLKFLIENPEYREETGRKSREYALKWHAAEKCAERYEALYDEVFS